METIHLSQDAINMIRNHFTGALESLNRLKDDFRTDRVMARLFSSDAVICEEILQSIESGGKMSVDQFMRNDKTETIEPGKAG